MAAEFHDNIFHQASDTDIYNTSSQQEIGYKTNNQTYNPASIKYKSTNQDINIETINGSDIYSYNPCLPSDLDIFSNLRESIFLNEEVRQFLKDLENALISKYRSSEFTSISFPKLTVSEQTDSSIVIDWIFNYFQMYFSFDIVDGNYWGTIMIDDDNGEFVNSVLKIKPERSKEQAFIILDYVCLLIG